MYTLSKEEIKECQMIKELHATYIKHKTIIENSEYPEPNSEAWVQYYEGRQKNMKIICDSNRILDMTQTSIHNITHGKKTEGQYLKEWKK